MFPSRKSACSERKIKKGAEVPTNTVRPKANTQQPDSRSGGFCRFAVMFDVELCRFTGVVRSMMVMAVGRVRVMCGEMMVPRFMMPRGFTVMMRGAFVMFCRAIVVLCCFSGH